MIAEALAVIVIVSSAVQLAYFCYFFNRLRRYPKLLKAAGLSSFEPAASYILPVSIIICAKNESQNLQDFLPAILQQDYHNAEGKPMYEVVLVDDQSTDDTPGVLAALQAVHPHLSVITITDGIQRDLPGKKFALSQGLAAARNEVILMTDADCKPATPQWIARMVAPLLAGRQIVAGYSGYLPQHSVLNLFIRLETIHTYLQFLSYALGGHPYMAVGRNLAAKKDLLLRAQAHPLWKVVPSGDDDLLVQLCATKENMWVLADKHAATWSRAVNSWGQWIRQKQRHLSTGKLYRKGIQAALGGYALSHALFLGSLALALLLKAPITPAFYLAVVGRFAVCWYLGLWCTAITTEHRLGRFWPLFDIGWLFYNVIFAPFIFWKNKQEWK